MDIKQALNSILPLQLRAKNKVEKSIKSDSTTDRDANGQQSFGGGQQHPPMSDEQFKKAMKHLITCYTLHTLLSTFVIK